MSPVAEQPALRLSLLPPVEQPVLRAAATERPAGATVICLDLVGDDDEE